MHLFLLLLHLLLLHHPSTAHIAVDVHHEITAKYPGLDPNGVFCPPQSSQDSDCSAYFAGLHSMLTSSSAMVGSGSVDITVPVRVVPVPLHNTSPSVPILSNRAGAAAYDMHRAQDDLEAKKGMAAAATKEDLIELQHVVDQIARLRAALATLADQVYEGIYLSEELPLTALAPVTRAVGSLFQRSLFNWHLVNSSKKKKRQELVEQHEDASDNFYKRLLPSEKKYLEYFFELYGYEHYNFHFGLWYGNRMSSFTWSHRSKGGLEEVRFACGTTSQEEPFAAVALDVLKARSIDLGDDFDANSDAFSFYGLGWDLEQNNFKVYIMFHGGVQNLPKLYKNLATTKLLQVGIKLEHADLNSHGLISLTYYDDDYVCDGGGSNGGDNSGSSGESGEKVCEEKDAASRRLRLHERKVYLYPTAAESRKRQQWKAGVVRPVDGTTTENVAWLLASKRGFVPQFDAKMTPASESVWRKRLSSKGSALMDKYMEIHLKLETIAYESPDKWTVYFPAGSG